jgi:hypothetical protein
MASTENEIISQHSAKADEIRKEEKVFIIGLVLFFAVAFLGHVFVGLARPQWTFQPTPWQRWWIENWATFWLVSKVLPGFTFVYFVYRLSRFLEASLTKIILLCLCALIPVPSWPAGAPSWLAVVPIGWLTKLLVEKHKYVLGGPQLRPDVPYKEMK